MICEEVESNKEVMTSAIHDEHEGVRIHNAVEQEAELDAMGDGLSGSSCVIHDGYWFVKALCLCAAELDGLNGLPSVTKHVSICSSVSQGGGFNCDLIL